MGCDGLADGYGDLPFFFLGGFFFLVFGVVGGGFVGWLEYLTNQMPTFSPKPVGFFRAILL